MPFTNQNGQLVQPSCASPNAYSSQFRRKEMTAILNLSPSESFTGDLFTEVSRGLDQKLWFVESHLHGIS